MGSAWFSAVARFASRRRQGSFGSRPHDIVVVPVMRDVDCICFLQWALPKLDMHWPRFRKVRHRVCKRVKRRIDARALMDSRQIASVWRPIQWNGGSSINAAM
jgi:hypothetical protein